MAILYASEILSRGLLCAGANEKNASTNVSCTTRIIRFKSCFGAHPLICARIWTNLESIDKERNLERFFLCLFWLKSYPTEGILAVRFNLGEETIRLWCWYYVNCLAILSETLIQMPETFGPDIKFPMAVDGTHCTIYEPMHDRFPMDRSYYSHKHHSAGFNYQVTVSTTEQKIYSIDGPYPAGSHNDMKMFKESGLQDHLVSQNRKAVADGGYAGPGLAVPNRRYHSKLTNIYFRRIRARMERVMGFFKNYSILSETFRVRQNRAEKHGAVFRAVGCLVAMQVVDSLFEV